MSTPIFDSVVTDVVHRAQVARTRLADARAGIDRLHGPDAHEQCPTCREPWPCATRRLVDGLSRGDLTSEASQELVDGALRKELVDSGEDEPRHTRIPPLADLFGGAKTGKALDVLFGRSED